MTLTLAWPWVEDGRRLASQVKSKAAGQPRRPQAAPQEMKLKIVKLEGQVGQVFKNVNKQSVVMNRDFGPQ